MATYTELANLAGNNILLDRIAVAITIAADAIVSEDVATANHANRLVWAKSAFSNPAAQAKPILNALLAANKGASEAQIIASTDAAIQTNVNAVIDIFAGV